MCGASIPRSSPTAFAGLDDDEDTRRLVAAHVAAEQVLDLMERGVKEFHFYTMNRHELVYAALATSSAFGRSRRWRRPA